MPSKYQTKQGAYAEEPWIYDGLSMIRDKSGKPIGKVIDWADQNIQRVLACVNACRGYSDPERDVPKRIEHGP